MGCINQHKYVHRYINNDGKTMINNPLGKMVVWEIAYGIVLPTSTKHVKYPLVI